MVWVRVVEPPDATGVLAEAYGWQAERLGEPTDFTKLGSLYPEIVLERLRLYKAVEGCPSALSELERVLAAYVVSLLNATTHCGSGLQQRLAAIGVPAAVVAAAEADPGRARTGDARLDAVCAYAAKLTLRPAEMVEADVAALRDVGLDDLDLVDLNNIVAYYNYLNRVSNGLGLVEAIPAAHALRALPGERVRTGIWLFPDAPATRLVDALVAAEAAGIGEVWLGDEGPARDPFTVLAAAAMRTSRVRLGIGVTNPYLRHPAVLASTMATVHECSGGRAVLGLGPGGQLSLDPVGMQAVAPLTACRRALRIIRAVLGGYTTEGYTPPAHAITAPDLPVFVGACGERFNRWASAEADGAFLAGIAPLLVEEVAGWARSVRPVELAVYVSALLDEGHLDDVRPRMIHAFSDGPDRLLAAAGLTRAEAVAAAVALSAGDPAPAAALLDDGRLDLVLARGPDQARATMERLAAALGPASVGLALLGDDPVADVERAGHVLAGIGGAP